MDNKINRITFKNRSKYQHDYYIIRKASGKIPPKKSRPRIEEQALKIEKYNIDELQNRLNDLSEEIVKISCFSPKFETIVSEMDNLSIRIENALKSK